MSEFLKKRWYLVLIFIPLGINIITNSITIKQLASDLKLSVLIISIIINIILLGEFIISYRKNIRISEEDKRIVKKLLDVLKVNQTEEILSSIPQEALIHGYYFENIWSFLSETERLENKITNKELNKYLSGFTKALNNYAKIGAEVFHLERIDELTFYRVPKKWSIDDPMGYKSAINDLNKMSTIAYGKLIKLIEFVKKAC